ncbi:hypothetical protein TNCV_4050331 [Trichonephila clavipes]|nr:hypothetical protein TNCV_4050331 [Trichonephila clavipes]
MCALVESMRRHVEKVISANGRHTSYQYAEFSVFLSRPAASYVLVGHMRPTSPALDNPVLDGTFTESPHRSAPSSYSSFRQMSGAHCMQWVYAVVNSFNISYLLSGIFQKIFGDNCKSHCQIFEWPKGFSEDGEVAKDDERSSRFVTSRTVDVHLFCWILIASS